MFSTAVTTATICCFGCDGDDDNSRKVATRKVMFLMAVVMLMAMTLMMCCGDVVVDIVVGTRSECRVLIVSVVTGSGRITTTKRAR